MGAKAYKPTAADRAQVEAMSAYGIPQADICRVIGISKPTLHKYYRDECDMGATKATAKVAESLFRKATGDGQGSVAAAIFWMKTRAGWRETTHVEHTGLDALNGLSRDDLKSLASALTVANEGLAGSGELEADGELSGGLSSIH